MRTVGQFLLLTILCVSSCILRLDVTTASQGAELVGGFSTVDPNDPKVVAIGKFAVDKHNEDTKAVLVFEKVVYAERKVDAGKIYNMTITAKDGDILNKYRVIVWVNLMGINMLLSFEGPM